MDYAFSAEGKGILPGMPDYLKREIKGSACCITGVKQVAGAGQTGLVTDVVEDYQHEMTQAKKEIEMAKQEKRDIVTVLETLTESTAKHSVIVKNLAVKAPEVAEQIQPALVTSEESRETAIKDLENITGTSYQEIATSE